MRLSGLMNQLAIDASLFTLDIIRDFDTIEPMLQIRANATYCKKIRKSDGEIRFDNAQYIYDKYRAFEGWPGIFTVNGLKIIEMSIIETKSINKEAEIISINDESITVGCSVGTVEIYTLQPVSKRAMDAKSYLLGRGLKVGDILI